MERGQEVFIPDRNEKGVVESKVHERSYKVSTDTGVFRRNRSDLNMLPSSDVSVLPNVPNKDTNNDCGSNVPSNVTRFGRSVRAPVRLIEEK